LSSSDSTARPWWRGAVFYQVYPRSFADSTGNGVGDLPGITARLPYIAELGVDAVWVSPFFKSPMYDNGYDVSDYCEVDPCFGTLADFDALVTAAHDLGLRVMIDWVPAHTSTEHRWFQRALQDPLSEERDYYVFRDPAPEGGPPNNWRATFDSSAPAWTLDPASGQYYLHSFLKEQADLNWHNPNLRAAMHDTLRFWLDRGVDGFRMDVVHNIGKDPALADRPEAVARLPHMLFNDDPSTHGYLREIRALLASYPGDRTSVGEVFLLDTDKVATYYGHDDELHMCFNFPPLLAQWNAEAWRSCIESTYNAFESRDAWPTWVLSNHDQKRHRTRYEGSELRARAAAVLLLTLRGSPFVYQGEELGLLDAEVPEDRIVDPAGRDGCRAPIPWTDQAPWGWTVRPWLPFPPECAERNVATQQRKPSGILSLYKRLLTLRRNHSALSSGTFDLLDSPADTIAYERRDGTQVITVVVNFGDRVVELPSLLQGTVLCSSAQRAAGPCRTLAPSEAVVLQISE
jgi:alpha-glucosidase